jgi:hypothetical protein
VLSPSPRDATKDENNEMLRARLRGDAGAGGGGAGAGAGARFALGTSKGSSVLGARPRPPPPPLMVQVPALVRREDADVVDAATALATLCSKWASGVDGRRALSTAAAISFVLAVTVSPVVVVALVG